MGEQAFTPGEWKWWTSCSWRRLRSDVDGGRKTLDVLMPVASSADGHPDIIVSEADMHLIVTAPVMYEALKEAERYIKDIRRGPHEEAALKVIRYALRKAEGR